MFSCEFPYCDYSTNDRSKIDYHHIIPREHDGTNDEWNLIYLCPNHHRRIYISGTHGNHSRKSEDSIEINGWKSSTGGKILEYIENGEVCYYQRS